MKRILSLALVIVLMLSLALPVSATQGEVSVDITYRSIKISLNGETITPCDANGNTVEPFVMDSTSTTYLPVRAVAQAMGLDVQWDAATSSAYLTTGGTVKTGAGEPIERYSQENVKINYRNIKVYLDGQLLDLRNANGEVVEPFILVSNGSIYLPIRPLCEALGLEVGWDAATSTAILDEIAPPEDVWYIITSSKTTINYTDGTVYKYGHELSYDANGNQTGWYSYDGDWYQRAESEYYADGSIKSDLQTGSDGSYYYSVYDQAGNITYNEYRDGTGNSNISKYTYDAQNRVITEEFTYTHDDGSTGSEKFTYRYEGNLRYTSFLNGEGYAEDWVSTLTYDAAGRIINEVTDRGGWTETREYRYDDYGNLIYDYYNNGDYWNCTEQKYEDDIQVFYKNTDSSGYLWESGTTYDAMGNMTSYYNKDNEGNFEQSSAAYDTNGNYITESYKSSDGTEYTINYTWNGYDLLKTVSVGSQGYNYVGVCTYDANGFRTSYKQTGDDSYEMTYTYDAEGTPLGETYLSDYEKEVVTYVYDAKGLNIRNEFVLYSNESGSWVQYATGATEYTYRAMN